MKNGFNTTKYEKIGEASERGIALQKTVTKRSLIDSVHTNKSVSCDMIKLHIAL